MTDTVGRGELRPGDFVFVEKKLTDPLGLLIVELDGSEFSHVGFVNTDGRIVNARTHAPPVWPRDGGGVQANTVDDLFEATTDRPKWLGRNHFTDEEIHQATEITRPWIEPTTSNVSGFSFAKLFIVAAGLDAIHVPTPAHPPLTDNQSRELLRLAFEAGALWDYQNMEVPGFFCSELVAVAFGLEFTPDQFQPPGTNTESVTPEGQSMQELGFELTEAVDNAAYAALVQLARTAFSFDHYFQRRAISAVIGFLWEKVKPLLPPILRPGIAAEAAPATLPTALITPRMLKVFTEGRGELVRIAD